MRIVLVAAMLAVLASTAYAKGHHQSAAQPQQSEQQKKKAAESEANYKASLGRIPDQKPTDPWQTLR